MKKVMFLLLSLLVAFVSAVTVPIGQYPIISGAAYYSDYTGPLFPAVTASTFAGKVGVPKHLTVSIFNMPTMHGFGTAFLTNMQTAVGRYYPQVVTGCVQTFYDNAFTACLWFNWASGNGVFSTAPDFLQITAHGQAAGPWSYFCASDCPFNGSTSGNGCNVWIANDWPQYFYNGKESMGIDRIIGIPANWGYGMCKTGVGNTKWVFQHNCLTLLPSDPMDYFSLFRGIHAIYGYASLTHGWNQVPFYTNYIQQNWACIWGCPYHYTTDVYNYFWSDMINAHMGMWDSWCQGNQQCSAEFASAGSNQLQGVDVACVYLTGYLSPDNISSDYVYFDGSQETITTMYNGLLPPVDQYPYWVSVSINYKHKIFGTPSYSSF
jgi:hypothetical protein